jgi:mono/diheme cytochrome c family protein
MPPNALQATLGKSRGGILRTAALTIGLVVFSTLSAHAQEITAYSKEIYSGQYPQQTGDALYKAICQGCHMADGRGAVGAATYPSLVRNPRLQTPAYAITVVANGRKAMPWFAGPLSDDQIAAVVNYIRTHFGNTYTDSIGATDVQPIRRTHHADED